MFNDQLNIKYNCLLKHLITNGFKCKKDSSQVIYEKDWIIIDFNSDDIIINDILDNRRFYFDLDTSEYFILNFLLYLDNNYKNITV
jgi:hypothetical protein